MSDIFLSSKALIARAKYHIRDLELQVVGFFEAHPYFLLEELDAETGKKIYKVNLTKPMPDVFPVIIFDAVNCLRAALDHAVYAIAIASGGSGDNVCFPFSSTKTEFNKKVNGRCKGLPNEIVNLMHGFEPYKGGDNLLWALNKLCNSNKHSFITPVGAGGATLTMGFFEFWENYLSFDTTGHPDWNRKKDELEALRGTIGDASKVELTVPFCVTLGDIDFIRGESAVSVLSNIADIVESVLMALEAEWLRISV